MLVRFMKGNYQEVSNQSREGVRILHTYRIGFLVQRRVVEHAEQEVRDIFDVVLHQTDVHSFERL